MDPIVTLILGIVAGIGTVVTVVLAVVRVWLPWWRRPKLALNLGQMGYLPDVNGQSAVRLRLAVTNEGRATPAREVEVIVVNAELPPRVVSTRPIRPDTSVVQVGLPARWADTQPAQTAITVNARATRELQLLLWENPVPPSAVPTVLVDVAPEAARPAVEIGASATQHLGNLGVSGLAGLEQMPALIRIALRSEDAADKPFTVGVNYDGFWPFGSMFRREEMDMHVRAKIVSGHEPKSPSPNRDPVDDPEDPSNGPWAGIQVQ